MALGLALLCEDGTPEREIELPVDLHQELMQWARKLQLRQLLRIRDYYRDVDFKKTETRVLAFEVQQVQPHVARGDLREFLNHFVKLLEFATSKRRTIHTIAD